MPLIFRKLFLFVRNYFNFARDFALFQFKNVSGRFSTKWKDRYPCLTDKAKATPFDPHYLYHTAWAARKIKEINPPLHVDIGSNLYFCSLLSAFVPVRFFDYRPAELRLSNLKSGKADLLSLPFKDRSVYSLSCMHTIEHVGLGRYGDPIDPDGDLKAISELKRVIAEDGNLLFVVPVGKPKIMFNAHRIYSYDQIMKYFSNFSLKEFSLITDAGKFIENADAFSVDGQSYACGCFWFKKNKT